MKSFVLSLIVFILPCNSFSQDLKNPSFEEVLSLQSVGGHTLSPDGKSIVYSINSTDWENNQYDTELWLSRNGEHPFQLTNNTKGSSSGVRWSPDGKWIAFVSRRDDGNQIYIINPIGGEAIKITKEKDGVNDFEFSPNGKSIAFTKTTEAKSNKQREDKFGKFSVEDNEYNLPTLWLMDFNPEDFFKAQLPNYTKDSVSKELEKPKALIDNPKFAIRRYEWSPDGKSIALNHAPNTDILGFMKTDISIFDVETKKVNPLLQNSAGDFFAAWSPDNKAILYTSGVNDTTSNFFKNAKVFIINTDGSDNRQIATGLDEDLGGFVWTPLGIFATASIRTNRHLYKIDPKSGNIDIVNVNHNRIYGLSFSKDGSIMSFNGQRDNELTELYTCPTMNFKITQLTSLTKQINGWKVAKSEVQTWQSEDGTAVEGVLHKPADFDPGKKYPLLVMIHGGPTGVDRPTPVLTYVYPLIQFLNKGAVVLRVNYRGSAGYGEAFRSLNVRNLGVGDAWDVLSGIDNLISKGFIDESKMGCMGWSQGGYISAYLTTNTNRFKAISVGAGISNWMTYYVNTDIHPFTRQYLEGTPWNDPEIYAKTSPMTTITKASTPTLIQHGEFDRRVPIPNAYELYQGLQDVGVETKLIVYKGFGHGITKPKERLAAVWHNWQWFLKYVWGEEVEIPIEEEK
ncbi:MAG TPA: S9 family peptidase [Cyclobacteriaceae bacterium]